MHVGSRWASIACICAVGVCALAVLTWPGGHARTPERRGAIRTHVAPPALSSSPAFKGGGDTPNRAVTLSGRVLDDEGAAVSAARVCLLSDVLNCCSPSDCAAADEDGRFQLQRHGRTPKYLVASASGFVTHRQPLEGASLAAIAIRLFRASAAVSGVVRDAAGGALTGALIEGKSVPSPRVISSAWSDREGRFRLNLPPGAAELRATFEAYSPAQTLVTAPYEQVELVMVPAAAILGQVIPQQAGRMPGGAHVLARLAAGEGADPEPAPVGSDGQFSFTAIDPGVYELTAVGERARSAPLEIRVDIGQTATVELPLAAAASVSGVMRRGGQPCEDGSLSLSGPVWLSARTSGGGAFSLSSVVPGRYDVTVRCEGATPLQETLDVTLEPVQRDFDLELGLVVEGVVQRERGSAVAGATVQVQPQHRDRPRSSPGAPVLAGASCESNRDGKFSCGGLSPGEYEVGAWLGGLLASEVVSVTLSVEEPAAAVLVAVRPFGSIHATLLQTSQPVAAASVLARGARGFIQARADGQRFVFDALELGAYSVFMGHSADAPEHAQRVELVRDGQVEEVTLQAPPTRSISGTVLDVDGSPAPDVTVRVNGSEFNMGDGSQTTVLTDPDGAFSIEGLLPGRYDVRASGGSGEATATAVLAGSRGLKVQLPGYGSLVGEVKDARGTPSPAFTVYYTDAHEQTRLVRGSKGTWAVPRVLAGPYRLLVTSGAERGTGQVHVRAGAAASASLLLVESATQRPAVDGSAEQSAERGEASSSNSLTVSRWSSQTNQRGN